MLQASIELVYDGAQDDHYEETVNYGFALDSRSWVRKSGKLDMRTSRQQQP
jgi:hypothetical protein